MKQSTNATKYKWNKIQIEQNAKIPKYKHDEIQKGQNTNCQNANVTKYNCIKKTKQNTNETKYKWNKIQIEQNAKIPKYNHHIVDLLP